MEPFMTKLSELLKQRAAAYDAFKVLAEKPTLTADEETEYPNLRRSVQDLDGQITRAREAQELAAAGAQPVAGQENPRPRPQRWKPTAMCAKRAWWSAGDEDAGPQRRHHQRRPRRCGRALWRKPPGHPRAEHQPGQAGGFIVPPDYMNEIIELLRPRAVVRAAGPRVIPMPRGTMTLPGQSSAASAGYGPEGGRIDLRSRASTRSWPATRS
jgi:HK97 family phage major capsid protein